MKNLLMVMIFGVVVFASSYAKADDDDGRAYGWTGYCSQSTSYGVRLSIGQADDDASLSVTRQDNLLYGDERASISTYNDKAREVTFESENLLVKVTRHKSSKYPATAELTFKKSGGGAELTCTAFAPVYSRQ